MACGPVSALLSPAAQETENDKPEQTSIKWTAVETATPVDIIQDMRRHWARVIIAIVLLTCVVCPVLELFDRWDHTVRTGNDTEYNFVLLGLCVGAAYAFARFVLGFPLHKSATPVSNLRNSKSLPPGRRASFFFIPTLLSPNILPLRI